MPTIASFFAWNTSIEIGTNYVRCSFKRHRVSCAPEITVSTAIVAFVDVVVVFEPVNGQVQAHENERGEAKMDICASRRGAKWFYWVVRLSPCTHYVVVLVVTLRSSNCILLDISLSCHRIVFRCLIYFSRTFYSDQPSLASTKTTTTATTTHACERRWCDCVLSKWTCDRECEFSSARI